MYMMDVISFNCFRRGGEGKVWLGEFFRVMLLCLLINGNMYKTISEIQSEIMEGRKERKKEKKGEKKET